MRATHLRCGMDVEVKGMSGCWMIVGFPGRRVRVVQVDAPGTMRDVAAGDLRAVWNEHNSTPTSRLADGSL